MSSSDDKPHPFKQFMDESLYPGFLEKPAKFIRENFVLPFRKSERPVYYHRRFERVPTIDQCEVNDPICKYEAHIQFLRDKKVDSAILKILRKRLTECSLYWGDDNLTKCDRERKLLEENHINWFIKYGELAYHENVLAYYMKQKHRMIWLRRRQQNGEENASYRD